MEHRCFHRHQDFHYWWRRVRGRTIEFAVSLPSEVIVFPGGWSFVGITTAVREGLEWTSEYAAVGVNGFGLPLLADGK
jgi:choloylglycine hydrolase